MSNAVNNVQVREATSGDIPSLLSLLAKYHTNTISDHERDQGFVTTNINAEQLASLIADERGVIVSSDADGRVVGFIIAGSWQFLSRWPMFEYMAGELDKYQVGGLTLNVDNSYQYGPICVDSAWRGLGLAEAMIDAHCAIFSQKYRVLVTFVNEINPRSMHFHLNKVGLASAGGFSFNNNRYQMLVRTL